jgi:DNA-binding NarL/FixJ family response regulator
MEKLAQHEEGLSTRTPRVLIVDDFETLRRGLKSLLGSAVCGEAENGQQAVEKVLELHPDLVVLDWSMPVMNGLQAAQAIRSLAPHVKILVFSLHAENAIREHALAAGAHACLHKTAKSEAICGAIEELLAPLGLSLPERKEPVSEPLVTHAF